MIWPFARERAAAARVDRLGPDADSAALAGLHAEAFARPWDAHEIERMLCDRNHLAHGLIAGHRPRGFALARRVLDEAEILTVVVGRDLRGRGHGGRLLAAHLADLAAAGVRVVHLEVEEGNAPALALYRRLGFAGVGTRAGYYLRPDGSRAAALTMRRDLA